MARGKNNEQKQNAKTVRHRQIKDGDKQTKAKKSDAAVEDPGKTVQKGRKRKTSSGKGGKREQEVTQSVAVDAAVGKIKTKTKSKRLIEWEREENLLRIEDWVRRGLSNDDIAHNMGIHPSTLYEWMKLSSEISETIKKGKDIPDIRMENALYMSGISGNVLAQIFWLKNRRPDLWQDRKEQKIEQKIDADIEQRQGVLILPERDI